MKKPKLVLPQPQVFKDVNAMRLKMRRKAQKLGWELYLTKVNERAGQLLGKPPGPSPAPGLRFRKLGLGAFGLTTNDRSTRRAVSAKPQ
jgi:hypothetical protein